MIYFAGNSLEGGGAQDQAQGQGAAGAAHGSRSDGEGPHLALKGDPRDGKSISAWWFGCHQFAIFP